MLMHIFMSRYPSALMMMSAFMHAAGVQSEGDYCGSPERRDSSDSSHRITKPDPGLKRRWSVGPCHS